jgi:hypothetical protein
MSCTPCAVGGGGFAVAAVAVLFIVAAGEPLWTILGWVLLAALVGLVGLIGFIWLREPSRKWDSVKGEW